MTSLFCQFMNIPIDRLVDESDDGEWRYRDGDADDVSYDDFSCDAEGSSCDDMDVDGAALDVESLASFDGEDDEDDDEDTLTSGRLDFYVTACYQKAGDAAWTVTVLHQMRDWTATSAYVSHRVEPTAYQIYRLIKQDPFVRLPEEFDHGFRIYVNDTAFMEHDGKDPSADGTGTLHGFGKEAMGIVAAARTAAIEHYPRHVTSKRKVWDSAFLADLVPANTGSRSVYVTITPHGVELPRMLTLTCGSRTLNGVSPMVSLVEYHEHQEEIQAPRMWVPENAIYTARSPLVALGWSVSEE